MSTYSKYKDSKASWIGDIPIHWNVNKVKYHFTNHKYIAGLLSESYQRLALTMNGVVKRSKEDVNGLQPEKFDDYQILNEDELVFKLIDLQNVSTSRVGLSPYTGIVSPAYIVLEGKGDILPEYAEKYFLMLWYMQVFNMLGGDGVRSSLNASDLLNIPICYPNIEEQKKIINYLKSRLNYIDKLINEQEKQIEMFESYKRELVANAITKGLNKTVPMKDSGVDWMGDVPEHWNVTKMKWMFEIVKRIYGAEDRDVLSITQRGIKVKDIDSNDGQLAESYANYQVVNVNDFAMNSMDLLTGWVDCSPYEGVTSPDYRVFRFHPDKPQCHTYYKYLFQMCYTNRVFYRLGQGVSNLGRWRLQADQFLNIRLPQPPIEEQEQIAAYLDKKVGQIEELTADIKSQIEKLKEYRKIVIHDAVTGKIKVTEGE